MDIIILNNPSNPKSNGKIMDTNQIEYINIPVLQKIIQGEGLEEVVYGDDERCVLLNKYFSFISPLEDANVPLPDIGDKSNTFLLDIDITTDEMIVDIIKILNQRKVSGSEVISHKMLEKQFLFN
jgi:hypothetical protein